MMGCPHQVVSHQVVGDVVQVLEVGFHRSAHLLVKAVTSATLRLHFVIY